MDREILMAYSERRDYYVYAHRDESTAIFYIGKGTGNRAWSTDRHPVWHRYVQERLGGRYSVEILHGALTEAEAEELEEDLIAQYGPSLVNWINPGRAFDFDALDRYHAQRGANLLLVAETRGLEKTDPELAVERYREAMESLLAYESITYDHGIVGEFLGDFKNGDLNLLDRLTLCLVRLGRRAEAQAEAGRYFDAFPAARDTSTGKQVIRRVTDTEAGKPLSRRRKAINATDGSKRASVQEQAKRDDIRIPVDPVERNIQGKELERQGLVDNAIEFYLANVRARFDGNFPYDRLAVIYRRRKDIKAEIEVLEWAVEVFEGLRDSPRVDVVPKLAKFRQRLTEAKRLAGPSE